MTIVNRRHLGLAAGMIATAGLTAGALVAATARAVDVAPTNGEAPPDFTSADVHGEAFTLSDFADRTVVLEWNNPECPYVMRHYRAADGAPGNIPSLQAEAASEEVVWITINSSADGQQGHRDAAGYVEHMASVDGAPARLLLDHSGELGHLYAAKTTPHLYVVDAGTLVYQGAIDSKATASGGFDGVTNYVRAALDAIAAGEPIETPQTVAYGCTVKYAS